MTRDTSETRLAAGADEALDETRPLGLFQGYGIELEYMIVDQEDLRVRAVADELLAAIGGSAEMEVELGEVAWSNELALHVIEMKTNGPRPSLAGLARAFQANVKHIEELLAPLGARLMPTAMHPLMDPERELKLWPHEDDIIYHTFDRIFDCRGHGWANLQSMHINLPFAGDDEFGRLHAAIRVLLPILPALAASSPVCDGHLTGMVDTRMHMYRHNARRVPSVSGLVVPEAVFTRAAYQDELLARVYRDLEPHDPDGVLRAEWVNARGCIARFDRSALEIRVLDVQECPGADIAVAAVTIAAVRALVDERVATSEAQRGWSEERLADLLIRVIAEGERTPIDDPAYLALFGLGARDGVTAGDLWRHIIETQVRGRDEDAGGMGPELSDWLDLYLAEGPLARRMTRALVPTPGVEPDAGRIAAIYWRLAECLRAGRFFSTRGSGG